MTVAILIAESQAAQSYNYKSEVYSKDYKIGRNLDSLTTTNGWTYRTHYDSAVANSLTVSSTSTDNVASCYNSAYTYYTSFVCST